MQELLDERDISRQLSKFVRLLDKRDWNGFADIFDENVVFDYAEGIERQGLSEILGRVSGFLDNCGATHHLLGSLIIEVSGDTAVSRAYIQSRHQGKDERSHLYFDACGEYIDTWERQGQNWRIIKRLAVNMLSQGDIGALGTMQSIN